MGGIPVCFRAFPESSVTRYQAACGKTRRSMRRMKRLFYRLAAWGCSETSRRRAGLFVKTSSEGAAGAAGVSLIRKE
jgi:hypothetical protein